VKHEYNLDIVKKCPNETFDAVVLGVSHSEFSSLNFEHILKSSGVVYDVKGVLPDSIIEARL
jgi:UDP-N-acetyl-D-galactosamine dehydrogenase